MILNLIRDAKKSAGINSDRVYMNAVEEAVMEYSLSTKFPYTICSILDVGNLDCDALDSELVVNVKNRDQIDGVAIIEAHAFKHNNLTNVKIPDSVTTIGENAFADNNVISVEIGSGITSIGNRVFYESAIYANNGVAGLLKSVKINNYEANVDYLTTSFGWSNDLKQDGTNYSNDDIQWKQ